MQKCSLTIKAVSFPVLKFTFEGGYVHGDFLLMKASSVLEFLNNEIFYNASSLVLASTMASALGTVASVTVIAVGVCS